jgi:hypothetical protein
MFWLERPIPPCFEEKYDWEYLVPLDKISPATESLFTTRELVLSLTILPDTQGREETTNLGYRHQRG